MTEFRALQRVYADLSGTQTTLLLHYNAYIEQILSMTHLSNTDPTQAYLTVSLDISQMTDTFIAV